jgi:hypothetical protein
MILNHYLKQLDTIQEKFNKKINELDKIRFNFKQIKYNDFIIINTWNDIKNKIEFYKNEELKKEDVKTFNLEFLCIRDLNDILFDIKNKSKKIDN